MVYGRFSQVVFYTEIAVIQLSKPSFYVLGLFFKKAACHMKTGFTKILVLKQMKSPEKFGVEITDEEFELLLDRIPLDEDGNVRFPQFTPRFDFWILLIKIDSILLDSTQLDKHIMRWVCHHFNGMSMKLRLKLCKIVTFADCFDLLDRMSYEIKSKRL
ncbi:hypothetical protein BTVI_71133 [Pitangus sulphuratus]|nr:hypothetical protein BTVI_71133 [Pitangus sulphuratus]